MSEAEVEAFLEHYGVKGMQWGVRRSPSQLRSARKQRKEKKYGGKDRKTRTAAQKRARAQRTNRRVNNTLAVVGGAIFVASLLSETGPKKTSNFNNYKTPSNSVKDIINKERNVKVSAIDKTFREGFIDADQRKKFVDSINKRYDRKLKDAVAGATK